jgi:hypothetical protein
MRIRTQIALVLCAAPLVGCSGYKAPGFRVAEVQLREQTETGTELLFVLEADNPNGKEIPLYEARYSVQLDGQQVFQGVRSPEVTLRRYATQRFVLPVSVPAGKMPPGTRVPYSFNASVTYIVPGAIAEILFDREITRPTSGVSDAGTLDFTPTLP